MHSSTVEVDCAASADCSVAETPSLEKLPDEIISLLCSKYLADDDYHQLTLPLTCKAFLRVSSSSKEASAARLVSRLRQVADGVVSSNLDATSNEWALAHLWGALDAVDSFLKLDSIEVQLRVLRAAPAGDESLRALLGHCTLLAQAAPPPRVSAESLFFEHEATRLQTMQEPALSPIVRLTAGDRAAREAAAALNLKGEARSALRREAQAQARRQLDATCRRRWKQMPATARRAWELRAVEVSRSACVPALSLSSLSRARALSLPRMIMSALRRLARW